MANSIIQKFGTLVSKEPSKWHEDAKFRADNRHWLKKSQALAIMINKALKDKSISQKDLAEKMSVSPQHINKIVKGRENLTLETISKIEMALNIALIAVEKNTSQTHYAPTAQHSSVPTGEAKAIAWQKNLAELMGSFIEASDGATVYKLSA